jgi:hypothetical protein
MAELQIKAEWPATSRPVIGERGYIPMRHALASDMRLRDDDDDLDEFDDEDLDDELDEDEDDSDEGDEGGWQVMTDARPRPV